MQTTPTVNEANLSFFFNGSNRSISWDKQKNMDSLESAMLARGVKSSFVTVMISTMRGFEHDGVDWATVTGAELVQRCGKPGRLHRLRCGLVHMFGNAEAREKWPEVFHRIGSRQETPGDTDMKKPTLEKVLPRGLYDRPSTDAVRYLFEILFRKLQRRGGMNTVLIIRCNLSFLYGFVCATPVSLWPDAHNLSVVDLKMHLKALTHEQLVHGYDRYRQESDRVN